MPVTKTAKRALRGSAQKASVNTIIIKDLDAAIRLAKKTKSQVSIKKASSLADRAAKKKVIHKNKAARIKSALSKLAKPVKPVKKAAPKKSSKKASKK
ncbi:MAG TPA: 30S ribosomal protein S20 [Patescibacteria group bacterium]